MSDESRAETPGVTGDAPAKPSRSREWWSGLALYLLGILTGVLAFATYNVISGNASLSGGQESGGQDIAMVRSAARDGTFDAIATLQAGGGPQRDTPTPAPTPTPLPKNAIAIREANRLGKADAPVTIVEYSDFQ